MPQISASVKPNTKKVIEEMAQENEISFSAMVSKILTAAGAHWIKNKSKKK